MSFPSADDLRRHTKPITKAERERAESLRRAQKRAESEARIEEGSWITKAERRQGQVRAREKAQADYERQVDAYLPQVRHDLEWAMRTAAARGERSVRVEIGTVGGLLARSEYPRGGVHSVGGKDVLDDTAATAGEIVADEVSKLGYTARVAYYKDQSGFGAESEEITVADIVVSW